MLDRLDHVRDGTVPHAPLLEEEALDLVPGERVPLDRVRAPGVQRPGPLPDGCGNRVEGRPREEPVPEELQYDIIHAITRIPYILISIYGLESE